MVPRVWRKQHKHSPPSMFRQPLPANTLDTGHLQGSGRVAELGGRVGGAATPRQGGTGRGRLAPPGFLWAVSCKSSGCEFYETERA